MQENNVRRAAQGEAEEARARTRQVEKELEQAKAALDKVTSLLRHPPMMMTMTMMMSHTPS